MIATALAHHHQAQAASSSPFPDQQDHRRLVTFFPSSNQDRSACMIPPLFYYCLESVPLLHLGSLPYLDLSYRYSPAPPSLDDLLLPDWPHNWSPSLNDLSLPDWSESPLPCFDDCCSCPDWDSPLLVSPCCWLSILPHSTPVPYLPFAFR